MKNLLITAVLLLIVSSLTFGQSANAGVSVTVDAVLTIFKINDLALGTVVRGNTVTVASTAPAAAAFVITGVENATTDMAIVVPATLSYLTSSMPFIPQIPVCNTLNSQAGTTALALATGGSATTNAVGNLWLWIGGGVTADPAQPSGNYAGTITVSVTQP